MLTNEQKKTLRILYGILALGCLAVLLGAPEAVIAFASLPGASYFLIAWYQYLQEQAQAYRELFYPV